MNTKKTPAEAEAYGGSIDGTGKDNTYLSNNQIIGESFESEKLIELINSKKRYIKTIDNPAHARMLQREILFLEEILPIVLRSTTLLYSELSTFFESKVRKAIESRCNVMVSVIDLSPTKDDTIRIGTVNTHTAPVEGIDLIINGKGRKTEEVRL